MYKYGDNVITQTPKDKYDYKHTGKENLNNKIYLLNDELEEVKMWTFPINTIIKIYDKILVCLKDVGKYSSETVIAGFDLEKNEEVFTLDFGLEAGGVFTELANGIVYNWVKNSLQAYDIASKKVVWQVSCPLPMEWISRRFILLLFEGTIICINETDGFVAYNQQTGQKIWNWKNRPDVTYYYSVSDDGVLHIIEDEEYIQLNARTGEEIRRFHFWPEVQARVKTPNGLQKFTQAQPVATKTHLLFGSAGSVFLINRATGAFDFFHALDKGFFLGFTFCIDENKIIYSCTDNKFGDATHKMVFLVFDKEFEV